jgi:hypothetical protein
MIISDKLVFITTPKTASTVIRKFLQANFNCTQQAKYIKDLNENDLNKYKFGVIRNPWEYYVSWYEYQKANGGGIWLSSILNKSENTFENFIYNLMKYDGNKKGSQIKWDLERNGLTKGFKIKNEYIGLYSWYYIAFFSKQSNELIIENEYSISDIKDNHADFIDIDYFCHINSLQEGLKNVFKNANVKNINFHNRKENTTKHKPYTEYYNKDMIELVQEKDSLIINTHGFVYGD